MKFGYDEIGSATDPCDEQYRGFAPFSEPETRAMRDFFNSHPDIKVAINLHSWGNLLITPYNWDPDPQNNNLKTDPYWPVYEDLHFNSNLPPNNLFGSGIQSIFYTANGDATDWMLKEKRIFAVTSELGTKNRKSEVFFPTKEIQ